MDKKRFLYVGSLVCIMSCSAENINFPAYNNQLTSENIESNLKITTYTDRVDAVGYASEITNASAALPTFSNKKVNAEIQNLKFQLKDYLGAIKENNLNGQKRAYEKYEKSYKKIQQLKSKLNRDEAEVLNRYLVLVKTNMNNLDNIMGSSAQEAANK